MVEPLSLASTDRQSSVAQSNFKSLVLQVKKVQVSLE